MKKLTLLAAASAAGLMTFAAHSQEAPATAVANNPMKIESEDTKTADRAMVMRVLDRGRFEMVPAPETKTKAESEEPGIDPTTVAAIPAGKAATLKDAKSSSGGQYHSMIARYASAYGVPASLAHAVVRLESNYRASARGRAGEIGLMQIKHSTARGMGYTGSAKGLYDPETNIKYGMKYLAQAHKLGGGNTCGTILKYNAGHGAKRMNPTSAAYCAKVKRLLGSS